MAVFIYVERWDVAGEGIRAALEIAESQDSAMRILSSYRKDGEVIGAKVIIGTVIQEIENSVLDEDVVLGEYNTNTDGHDV